MLIGVHEELEKDGYTVFLGTTFDSDNRQDQLLSTMLEHRVGGIILCPVAGTSEDTIRKIQHLDVPSVLAVRELPEVESDYVGVDYSLGVQKRFNTYLNRDTKELHFRRNNRFYNVERKNGRLPFGTKERRNFY